MSDFGEALGTATEGGLFAKALGGRRAAEADASLARGHFAEGACLNCGTQLLGAHCHECGQRAHLHRTLGAFMHDLLHGALHFEGKTWKTLPMLAFRPGQLTRRYIDGERARFVSPMALFLFSIFLMFAVFQAVGVSAPADFGSPARSYNGLGEVVVNGSTKDLIAERAKVEEQLAKMAEDAAERERLEARKGELDGQLAEADEALAALEEMDPTTMAVNTPSEFLNHAVEKWQQNPGLMAYKLQSNSYKFSWLLIPLSIPFMWLLFFWKRRFRAYDHAIFVTYSIAFMSLLFIVVSLLMKFGAAEWLWGSLIAFVPPLHIYKQLRGAYGLSRSSALWRLSVLGIFIAIVLTLFLNALLLLGAF